jgi:hypothetical protein
LVSILAKSLREIENNCDRYHVILTRQSDQRLTRLHLNIGRIDYSELSGLEPLGAIKCKTSKAAFVAA